LRRLPLLFSPTPGDASPNPFLLLLFTGIGGDVADAALAVKEIREEGGGRVVNPLPTLFL
jgi:hypothetical protein